MKCSFCGNEVEKGMKYCPLCGAEVKEETSENQTPETEKHDEPNGGYSYGQSSDDSNGGYSYGQSSNDPNGGYNYGQNSGNPNGGYNYGGQPGNGYNPSNNGQPGKQISGTPYIIFSILVTLCCCLPLGIVSIVYACKINSLQNAGDYEGAKAAAKKAKIFMIVGAVGGLIGSVGLFATGYLSDSTSVQTVENMLDEDTDTATSKDDAKDTDTKENAKDDKKEDVTASEDLGDSWNSYTVQINDSVMTFPCDVSKLEEAGLTLDTDDKSEDYVINTDDYELVYFQDANANSLMFVMTNKTDSAKTIKECTVSGVYVDEYDVEDGSLTVIFPGDVQIGMDISDVEAKWGEPSDTYEGDYSDTYTWYDEDTYNYCTVSVDPDTKKVTTIDLDGEDL